MLEHLSAINLTAMAKSNQKKFIPCDIEVVNDPVISHPHAKLRPPLQTMMRIGFQPRSQIPNRSIHRLPPPRCQVKKNRVEIAGVDFRRLLHMGSGLMNTNSAGCDVLSAALNSRNELRVQLSLILQIAGKPVLQAGGLISRQSKDFLFDGLKFGHRRHCNGATKKVEHVFSLSIPRTPESHRLQTWPALS